MGQGVLSLGQIKWFPWCIKCTRNLAIFAYAGHIQCYMANIGGLTYINRWLLISEGVKFVTGSGLALTPCHLSYSPYLS